MNEDNVVSEDDADDGGGGSVISDATNGCGSPNGTSWRCDANEQQQRERCRKQLSPSVNRFKNDANEQNDDGDDAYDDVDVKLSNHHNHNHNNQDNSRAAMLLNAFGGTSGSGSGGAGAASGSTSGSGSINNNITNSNTSITKGKNHPSFTIILRRKLPIINPNLNNNEVNLKANNNNNNAPCSKQQQPPLIQSHNPQPAYHHHHHHPSDRSDPGTAAAAAASGPGGGVLEPSGGLGPACNPTDFKFSGAWQIWLLNENDDQMMIHAKDHHHGAGTDGAWNIKCFGPPSSTARQFWSSYQQLNEEIKGRELAKNIMIFRDRIQPKWEDKCNIGGGRWFFDLSHHSFNQQQQQQQQSSSSSSSSSSTSSSSMSSSAASSQRDFLIKFNSWTQCIQIVMSQCLGSLDDLIVGMILHFKSNKYRVSLWVRTQTNFNQVIELGKQLQKHLNLRCQIKFELHTGGTATNGGNQAQIFNGLKIDSSAMDVICNQNNNNDTNRTNGGRKW